MPRTDDNGKQITTLLTYLLDGDVDVQAICDALGIGRSTYYRRLNENDFPDAEELRKIAAAFGLNFLDLLVRFGLLRQHDLISYLEAQPRTKKNPDSRAHT
jgi:transcriptional regulator with XRE-family HTH domain